MKLSTQLIITTLSKGTHSVSIFILSIILSHYFTKDEYGTYLHVQLIANFSIWAFLLGIPHSVYYFFPRVRDPRKFILFTVGIITVLAFCTSGLVTLSLSELSNFLSNPKLIDLSVIIFLMIIFQVPLTLFEPLMISAKLIKEFSRVELFFNLSLLATVAIPVYFGAEMVEILWFLSYLFLLHSCIVFYYAIIIFVQSRLRDGEDYSISDQFKYSLPIGMSMGVMEVSRYTDKVMVSNQSSVEEYAEYTRGAIEIPIISIVANTLDNLMMPKFVEAYKNNDTESILYSWHSVIRMMATFIYPCCIFLICSASILIPLLFSDKYIGSVIIFQIYTLGLLTRISTFNVIIRAIGKTRAMLWVSLFSIFSNIALTYLFMSLWGLIGAPIATVITTAAMRYVYLLTITGYLNINLSEVFPWKSLLISLVSSLIACLPILFIIQLSMNVWLQLLVMAVIYGVLYLFLMKKTNALEIEEKKSIRAILPDRLKWLI